MTLCQGIRRKEKDKKGFTLGELLIVVAIIGVLVSISVPTFTKQIRKAQIATIVANTRSYYALVLAEYIECQTYGYQWEIDAPIHRDGNNDYLYFVDHNGNEQKFPLPGFDKLNNHGVIITWGLGKLDGTNYYSQNEWGNPPIQLKDNYYPFFIVTADGEQYMFGTVPDNVKEAAEKEEPKEVGFEFDE